MVKKIILWILVILWALLIFSFSAQKAEDSDEVSLSVGEKIITIIAELNIMDIPASTDGIDYIKLWAENINNIIRKLAHFGIFMMFGILLNMLLCCYMGFKKAFLYSLVICLLYAISDEIHQYFVPGRACMLKDVLIDFCGSFFGVFIINFKSCIFIKFKKASM